MKMKENGENIKDDECLAEELQKYICLYAKRNKGYKEREWEENAWIAVEKFSQLKVY